MISNNIQKNPAIAGVIRNFVNKKSGKVVVARMEIMRRFNYLDWKDQRKIILAFLVSNNKADRIWIYIKLLKLWDKRFYDIVQQLWEKYHEIECGWLIIRYFPLAYIETYKKELMIGRNFYFLCKRFVGTEGFTAEPILLDNLMDRLDILSLQKAPIADIESTLKEIIKERCNHHIITSDAICYYNPEYVSFLNIKPIYQAYNILQKNEYHAGCRLMEKWDGDIRRAISLSSEAAELKKATMNGYTNRVFIAFLVKIVLKYFDIENDPDFFFPEVDRTYSNDDDAYQEYYSALEADQKAAEMAIAEDKIFFAEKAENDHKWSIISNAIGKSFITTKAFTIGYLIHYAAPYTGSGKMDIEAGVVLKILSSMNDTCLYCRCEDEELIRSACDKAYDESASMLKNRFNGISFFIDYNQLEYCCREMEIT